MGQERTAESKTSVRDPALTWDVPPEIEEARSKQLGDVKAAFLQEATAHIDALTAQLLAAEGIKNIALWSRIISGLAQKAVEFISPRILHAAGWTDPQNNVTIEVAPGAVPTTSQVIDGIVFRGNVAHKRMRTFISRPRVMTLSGSLEYEKPANAKLSTFDALMDSEKQHLSSCVQTITAVEPDLVLVSGSVARYAQELLLAAGVSVVAHIGTSDLARAALCVNAKVNPAHSMPQNDCLGICKEFEVITCGAEGEAAAAAAAHAPSIVVLRGSAAHGTGSSIILRATEEGDIDRLHKVARLSVQAAYWNKLESAVIADQFVAAGAQLELPAESLAIAAEDVARHSAAKVTERRGRGAIFSASPHVSVTGENENGLDCKADFTSLQQLWTTISCRNPAKGVVCEPHHVHSMVFYDEGDLSLPEFLAAASPKQLKCPHPQCGDGAALHLRSFLHGDSQITLSSVHLPPGQELPQGVWLWLRRIGSGGINDVMPSRRIALSNDASYLSFSHLLSLLFDARDVQVGNIDLRHDFVRYLGQGRTIICLHHTCIELFDVALPPSMVLPSEHDQAKWLQDEVKVLGEEADEIFSVLQIALSSFPPAASGGALCLSSLQDLKSAFLGCIHELSLLAGSSPEVIPVVMTLSRLRRILFSCLQLASMATCGSSSPTAGPTSTTVSQASSKSASMSSSAEHSRHPSDVSDMHLHQHPKLLQSAPMLMDSEPHTAGETIPVPTEKVTIPTGLVARYISRFEAAHVADRGYPALREAGSPDGSNPAVDLRRPSITIDLRRVSGHLPKVSVAPGKKDVADICGIASLENNMAHFEEHVSHICGAVKTQHSTLTAPNSYTQALTNLRRSGRVLFPHDHDQLPVTVFDDEMTSIVAYFLSTSQYHNYLTEATKSCMVTNDKAEEGISGGHLLDEQVLRSKLQLDCQMIAEDPLPSLPVRYRVTAYYAPQFAALRRICIAGGEDAFLASLSRCRHWFPEGGKSGVYFAKTRDEMYVIKQLSRVEIRSFLEFAPDYFRHVSNALNNTCLSKIIGVYEVCIEYLNGRPAPFGGKEGTIDIIVMQNCFSARDVSAKYDLKGSGRERYVDGGSRAAMVLLDDNMKEANQQSPTLITPPAFERLQKTLRLDCSFLASIGVMDYSLLVGVDKTRHELIMGLVDFLRQFTLDKQLESIMKTVGAAGKEPTVISPKAYAERFVTAIASYFTVVPRLGKPAGCLGME